MSEAKNYLEAIQEEMSQLINHISIANLEEAKSCIINARKKENDYILPALENLVMLHAIVHPYYPPLERQPTF